MKWDSERTNTNAAGKVVLVLLEQQQNEYKWGTAQWMKESRTPRVNRVRQYKRCASSSTAFEGKRGTRVHVHVRQVVERSGKTDRAKAYRRVNPV